MSSSTILNEEDFQSKVLESKMPVLVKFSATWCGPCKSQNKVIQLFESTFPNRIKIVDVDIDDNPNLAKKYYVSSIPSILIFVNGVNVGRKTGLMSVSSMDEFIASHRI